LPEMEGVQRRRCSLAGRADSLLTVRALQS